MELKVYYEAIPSYNGGFYIKKRETYSNNNKLLFSTEKKATNDFLKAKRIADKKINTFFQEIDKIKKKLNMDFFFDFFL